MQSDAMWEVEIITIFSTHLQIGLSCSYSTHHVSANLQKFAIKLSKNISVHIWNRKPTTPAVRIHYCNVNNAMRTMSACADLGCGNKAQSCAYCICTVVKHSKIAPQLIARSEEVSARSPRRIKCVQNDMLKSLLYTQSQTFMSCTCHSWVFS